MKLLKFKIGKDEEVIKVLTEKFRKLKLTTGAIVSVIGAVEGCKINNMKKK